MSGIVIDKIAKLFGAVRALEEISLTIADGEFIALLGPSGCGKTTLLRIIAGLENQSSGSIRIGERDVSALKPAQRGIAMVFQNYAVFPHMNVFENVAFGLRLQKAPEALVKARVGKVAALLHIEPYLQRYPAKLSGGQRQRVAVARALAVEPAVLLMDEPLSNLDALLRLDMRAELKTVLQEAGTTTVYVTHDQTEAMGLADRIALMHGGKIVQVDTPANIYARPATRFVGGFVGSPPMNFISLAPAPIRAGLQALGLAPPSADADLVGFRGEDASLRPAGEGLGFRVRVAEPMGSHMLLTGHVHGAEADGPVRIVAPAKTLLRAGDTAGLAIDPGNVCWFSSASGKALGAVH